MRLFFFLGGVEYKVLRNRPVCYRVSSSALMKFGRNLVTWSW